jgi:ribonuclease D
MDEVSAPASLLSAPAGGIPPVVSDPKSLARALDRLSQGQGPIAVDAERASGYRYGQRAYLIQLRRVGTGTVLLDPIACPDLGDLAALIADEEWILHAASQDLPCLLDLGLRPTRLFDTELGARLAGCERVGLGALTESLLGISLAKEHSSVDWSTRPFPEAWLGYAALDVELLHDLRDAVAGLLEEQGKLDWALEEFSALVAAPAAPPRVDPWRRTNGMHAVRNRQGLAVVKALWERRDHVARARDIAPGRILPDSAIIAAALALPTTEEALIALPVFGGRATRRSAPEWLNAIRSGLELPESQWPAARLRGEGPPPPRVWADREPTAFARLSHARAALAELGERLALPVENILTPDLVRRLCWQPPQSSIESLDPAAVAEFLRAGRAREWQIALATPLLAEAMLATTPLAVEVTEPLAVEVTDG